MAYLYRHIRLDKNIPFYIGVGHDDRNYRRAYDVNLRNSYWKNIVSKTGFEVDILLDNLSSDEVYQKEIEFIRLYGRSNIGNGTLVNLTDGGNGTNGCKHSIKSRKAKSEMVSGRKHPMFGKKHSQETLKRMSDIKKNKKHSDETLAKILKHNLGRKMSDFTKKSLYNSHIKSIIQYDLNGNFIKEYSSISEAASLIKGGVGNISRATKEDNIIAYGYMWKLNHLNNYVKKIEPYAPKNTQKKII